MLRHLSDNLNILMAKARLSSSELARHIGIPATTIKRIRNNEQSNPTITTLMPIAKYFSVSLNELIGDKSLEVRNEPHSMTQIRKIPLLSWSECIHSQLLDYNKCSQHIFTERQVSNKAFALKTGDHELEFFRQNSILIIEPDVNLETNNFVIVANIEYNIASIRKYLIEIDQIYLKPLTKGLATAILTDNYKILGVIVQCKMELKT